MSVLRVMRTFSRGIRGRLEGCQDGLVHGWAFDPRHPFSRQIVSLRRDDGAPFEIAADCYRADLYRAGLGDGYFGFLVPLAILSGSGRISASVGHKQRVLQGSPLSLAAAAMPSPERLVRSIRMRIDQPSRGRMLTGWAIDDSDPNRRLDLVLQHRAGVLARARATRFRPDIGAEPADALHGFLLSWDEPVRASCTLIDASDGTVLRHLKVTA